MNFAEFQRCMGEGAEAVPSGLPVAVQALWYDARGDWDEAHRCAQEDEGSNGSWVHAYLHRKEGDLSNARYWYRRAGKEVFDGSLDEEWERIARALLSS
jgi:hypothetical protein